MQRLILTALALLLAAHASLAESIARVEPPNWWVGFEHRELQLMIHGDGIGRNEPSVRHDDVTIARVVRGDSPNYLFVYLDIAEDAAPGTLELRFESDGDILTHNYELKAKNSDPGHAVGFSAKDAIYLVTPDRFANGNPANDTVEGMGDPLNRDDDYGRHGGDLAGVAAHLDYIADMGFTQLWLNPILENKVERASYHGYSTTDYYAVDPRFGTNAEFKALTDQARSMGVGMIMDQIVNHIGIGHWWMDDLPTEDWLNFQNDVTITSHARTVNLDQYASEYDRMMHTDGWFVESMPDLNQRNPLLADYLIQNSIWWIETVGLSGIRQDTWPYPDKHFMAEWARRIMQQYPDFNIVGEEWSTNPVIVSYWQRGKVNPDGYVSHLPSVFDFPLQDAVVKALTTDGPEWQSPWTSVYESLANDILYPDPLNIVIFPDNHDMDRIFTQLNEDENLFRIAIALFATMRGIPQFFYGDEILMSHTGTSSHGALRMDMPGGFEGGSSNAFTGDGLTDAERSAQEFVRTLLNWRKNRDVVHYGRYMQYAPIGDTFVYFRYDEDDTVMVVFNRSDETQRLELDRFYERINSKDTATDIMNGKQFMLDDVLVLEPMSVHILDITRPGNR